MFTRRLPFDNLIAGGAGLLALVVLALNLPDRTVLLSNPGILIAYSLMIAVAINVGVKIGTVEISPVHGVGILLLLSLPRAAVATSLWVVVLASFVGEIVFAWRQRSKRPIPTVIFGVARMILSFYAAALVYTGPLPLRNVDGETILPVIILGLTFTLTYGALFLLEVASASLPMRSLRPRLVELILLLFLPIPFSVLGAVIFNQLSVLLFAIYLASLALILVRFYELARTQRLEVQALSLSAEREVYERQRERVSQLATLNRILTLLTDTLSPDTVLDTVISSASMLGDSSAVAVYLYNQDELTLARSAGLSDAFAAAAPLPLIAVKADNQDDELLPPVVITNVESTAQAGSLTETMQREGKAAWIEFLLAIRGVRLGVLTLYYNDPREFSPEIVELLRTYANQCAQAISNARLYASTDKALERRVGQLLALGNIGHHLTATFEVGGICELVAEYAQQSTSATAAAMLLINRGGQIEQWAAAGYTDDSRNGYKTLLTKRVTADAVRTKTPVMIGDVQPGDEGLLPNARAQLTMPILWNEAVVGAITLESDQANAFSEEDNYFVKQLANQAIIAIENARLFRSVSEARDRVQLILNTVREALILISTAGEIVLVNPRVEMLGLNQDDLIGRTLGGLLGTSTLGLAGRLGFRTGSEIQRLVKELRAPGGLSIREEKHFTVETDDDALVYVERQVFPVYDDHGHPLGVLLVFYDQTEEMRLAKNREEFSQMLVHDLRSPLTSVTTALKLLTDLTPKDSDFRPLIESTTDASRRAIQKLLNRVDALLDVSRMESGLEVETKPTELLTLVDNVCIELSPLAQELEITLKADIDAELPMLDIDADKVERVLLNLMDNALKFSPADSQVVVRAHEPGAEGAAPGFVRIDVVDAGPGVPDEYKLLLFDRFVQVRGRKGARRGTGLGLTFCRLVAETHGGRIWIDDNPTGGSVFSLTLPVALESALRPDSKAGSTASSD